MKIAFVGQPSDGMAPPIHVGSVALWIYYMARQLTAQNHSVIVIGNNGSRLVKKTLRRDHVNYVLTPTTINSRLNRAGTYIGRIANQFSRKNNIDIYGSWQNFYYAFLAARVAARAQVDVVHVMNYSQFVPIIRSQNANALIALHMHCEWLTQFPREIMLPRLRQTDLIIGCSQYITELIVDKFPEFAEKCVTVPNAADSIANAYEILPKERRVLYVGRLSPEKGVHDLITAFRVMLESVPDATLHLVGSPGVVPFEYLVGLSDDPHVSALRVFYERQQSSKEKDSYLEALEQIAGPEIGRRIFFEGYADHNTISQHYLKAAVLVNPSLSESFGISVIEAMMMKLPVVATRVGGMTHTVVAGETGLLVDPADSAALANAISKVLTDSELAHQLGSAGYARAQEKFSWHSAMDQLLDVYSGAGNGQWK